MAELTSTIVKGSVNATGKIKSKGYVLPTINSNGESIPLLELTVIGNDLYIDTHQVEIYSDTTEFSHKPIDAYYETVYLSFGNNLPYYEGTASGYTFQVYSTSTGSSYSNYDTIWIYMEDSDEVGVESSNNGGMDYRYINSANPLQQIEGKCLWVFDVSSPEGGMYDFNFTPTSALASGIPLLLKIKYSNGKLYKVN